MTWRNFKNRDQQKVYNHLRGSSPGEEIKGAGLIGNAYYVGRWLPDPKKRFAPRGSLAFAAWAAGIDDWRVEVRRLENVKLT